MRKKDMKISYNGMDIAQRFMAKKMIGQSPLKALDFETAKVLEVLPTDLPKVSAKEEQADTLYLLEDGTFLHVEYQTTVKKHDSFRFAGYVMGLYNIYKDYTRFSVFKFQTVVIYAPHIKRGSVNPVFDLGSIQYHFQPLFLQEVQQEESYVKIIDKIRCNPNVELTEEEKMVILYHPLFNSNKKDIETDTLLAVKDIQEISDERVKAQLTGTIFVLAMKYLSENSQNKIWEVLKGMNVIREEMEQQFIHWHLEERKKEIKETLLLAFKKDDIEMIEHLKKQGKFTEEEIEEIQKEATHK